MKETIYSVLIRPLVTEKGTHQATTRNAYSFQVAPWASKAQIRQAVEKIYNVRVLNVRTANRKGKARRVRWNVWGSTSRWKKAVVVLHPDHRIDLF